MKLVLLITNGYYQTSKPLKLVLWIHRCGPHHWEENSHAQTCPSSEKKTLKEIFCNIFLRILSLQLTVVHSKENLQPQFREHLLKKYWKKTIQKIIFSFCEHLLSHKCTVLSLLLHNSGKLLLLVVSAWLVVMLATSSSLLSTTSTSSSTVQPLVQGRHR